MLDAVRRGDRIVTSGGLIGLVTKVKDDNELQVEIAENVRVRVMRHMVSDVLNKTDDKSEPEKSEKLNLKRKRARKRLNFSMPLVCFGSGPPNQGAFGHTGVPLKTLILVVWCVKLLSAILKYIKYSAVLENNFPASQLRLKIFRGTHWGDGSLIL